MKGLLLKDWYMLKSYCRTYLLIAVCFFCVAFYGDDNLMFLFYPCILCGMIPINLLAYDESSHWQSCFLTFPYTRNQYVSSKYLIGLIIQLIITALSGIITAMRMISAGTFILSEFLILLLLVYLVSSLNASLCMPLIFRYGAEKGRIAFILMFAVIGAAGFILTQIYREYMSAQIVIPAVPGIVIFIVLAGVYVLTWLLSQKLFAKKEL
ncbi:MAG: ABC-2 transporter permease [Bulleidia sp.]